MDQEQKRAGNVHEHVLQPEPPPGFPRANRTSAPPVPQPSRRKGASPPIRVSQEPHRPSPPLSPPRRDKFGRPWLCFGASAGSFRICIPPKGTRSATSVPPLPANSPGGAPVARVARSALQESPDHFAPNKCAPESRPCPAAAKDCRRRKQKAPVPTRTRPASAK